VLWNSGLGMPVLIGFLLSLTDVCVPFKFGSMVVVHYGGNLAEFSVFS
jgi:hypothetical protein